MANTFKRKLSRNIGTSLTVVGGYTVGASTQTTVIGLAVSNTSASQVLVDATLNDASNDYYLIKEAPVPSGGSIVIVGAIKRSFLKQAIALK